MQPQLLMQRREQRRRRIGILPLVLRRKRTGRRPLQMKAVNSGKPAWSTTGFCSCCARNLVSASILPDVAVRSAFMRAHPELFGSGGFNVSFIPPFAITRSYAQRTRLIVPFQLKRNLSSVPQASRGNASICLISGSETFALTS